MAITSKFISITISSGFFFPPEIDSVPKITRKIPGNQISQNNLDQEEQIGKLTCPDFKSYCK